MAEIAQRRERDADAAREAIINAAERQFAQKGFAGARIDEIAQCSGYNKSLICHQYFRGKEGLYEAVIRRMKQRGTAALAKILTPTISDPDAPLTAEIVQTFLVRVIRARFDYLLAHETNRRILAWEAAEGWNMYSQMHFTREELGCVDAASAFIRRAQEAGFIRPEIDPTILLAHVMGSVLSYLLSLPSYHLLFPETDFASPEALARAREQIVELIVQGVMPPSRSS
jgi:TetR/AcrR family transcriptional regulator